MEPTESVQIPKYIESKTVSKLLILRVLLSDLYRWFFILPDLFMFWLPIGLTIKFPTLYAILTIAIVHVFFRVTIGKKYVKNWEKFKNKTYVSCKQYSQSVINRAIEKKK